MDEDKIFTVSQLNQQAKLLLETGLATVWINGELSNVSRPSSGHWYFSLKDTQAQVRCAMFAGRNRQVKFTPSDGLQVLARAQVSLYEARGDFQLIVDRLEPVGDGLLFQAFEALKKQLFAEGLFAPERKKALPVFPRTIGVITSPTGAVIRDILTTLRRRFKGISVIVYPTAVQGAQAKDQIVRALQLANERAECDVLILARGGGSLEDLWPFNEESVARAVAASHLPIVSGVGHEVDVTIVDFVADVRAATPTAAAELLSPEGALLEQSLQQTSQRLIQGWKRYVDKQRQQLMHWQERLRHPRHQLEAQAQRLDDLEQRLKRAISWQLQRMTQFIAQAGQSLNTVSPLATLQRGYAVVLEPATGHVLRSEKEIAVDATVNVRLADGEFLAKRISSSN